MDFVAQQECPVLCPRSKPLRRFLSIPAWLVVFSLTAVLAASAEDRVAAVPLGNKVELQLQTGSAGTDYVLEARARLVEGEEWAPLLQFKGSSSPRSFVDALCGTTESRYFRLRRLLAAPPVEVSNFRLIDIQGAAHELYYQRFARAVAVVLAGTGMPGLDSIQAELVRVRQSYDVDRLPVWIVSSTGVAERGALAEAVKSLPASFVVLQDPSHAVHRTLGSGRKMEVVLVSTLDWSVVYRGPVEETVDAGVKVVRSTPFADAVNELMADKPVSVARLENSAVDAGLRAMAAPSYTRQVAPLLLKSCMPCHQPGDIAPWSMTNHAVIKEYSRLIKSSVLAGEMPPWHADPAHQVLSNSKALAPEEVDLLVNWIDQGCVQDEGEDPLLQVRASIDEGWPMGKPDAIISLDPQEIPATGVIDYRYLFSQSPFPNDVWLRAIAVKPGDRSVVHHCLVFKGGLTELANLRGGLAGFFAGYVPGMEQVEFPEGTGKLLKKSDLIVFQMHYTVSGKATTDRTQLGLYLARSKPARELVTTAAYNTSINIPPNTKEMPINASRTFAKKSLIYEFSPHMHFRGSRARFTAIYPDGRREVLLNVPAYFFNWQALYRLKTPKEVPAGTRLLCEGAFDNSVLNRFNPDPSATVRFGEQSWEEMFIGYVNFSEVP